MSERTVGVEEELLLVDPQTGLARAEAPAVLSALARKAAADPPAAHDPSLDTPGGTVEHELQREQIEIDSVPHRDIGALLDELRRRRRQLADDVAAHGVAAVALATFPMPVHATTSPDSRYQRMVRMYGPTGREQLLCGTHVHVAISDDEEAVAVLDRLQPWLPVLLALSANSPYWQGEDTSYESYRGHVWLRWPTAGPTNPFGSAQAYRDTVAGIVRTGAVLDDGMVYWDARLGRGYPTVEIRVADVCTDVRDAALLAALCRGLVETAARSWREGQASPGLRTEMLRPMSWRAARSGVRGELVDPETLAPAPAWAVVDRLRSYVAAALGSTGDDAMVDERLAELRREGTGAHAQRRSFGRRSDLADVVRDAVERTVMT